MLRDPHLEPRALLLQLLRAGLAAVDGRTCTYAALRQRVLPDKLYLVAVGKAADAMAAGAIDAIGERLCAGLVITRHGYQDTPVYRDPRVLSLEAGHPLPDEQSLAAGNALRLFLADAPADAHFLFLISGGASSLVEVPVEGVTLPELRSLNRWLLASGWAIDRVNRVRTAFSRIKGGRLLRDLDGRAAELLLISDVPGDVPQHIGSGMLLPPEPQPLPELPPQFTRLLKPGAEFLPSAGKVNLQLLATNRQACEAVLASALARGQAAWLHETLPAADAAGCGAAVAEFLLTADPGIHIWGGETVVRLPPRPGRGGRSQALALAAARRLQSIDNVYLLAAGTDGTDGNSSDAGALVDGETLLRGRDAGFDADDCLARADAGSFLDASGDLIYTGPTGTNVMDLIIARKSEPGARDED